VSIIGYCDPDFPVRLKTIPDPPVLLFVKGNPRAVREPLTVAVVGTRKPTTYGRRVAGRLGLRFAEQGVLVVSGLAEGCDTAAHVGCLKGHGVTTAVLAHGLDVIYPSRNKKLAERILANNGCLVSEYPLGTTPRASYFVQRDRLQSGLALAVVVVETDVKGGTMHTVGYVQEQRRLLACVVHPDRLRQEPKTQGNRKLLEENRAIPLKDAKDLMILIERMKEAEGDEGLGGGNLNHVCEPPEESGDLPLFPSGETPSDGPDSRS
jgi:DNA processing protein